MSKKEEMPRRLVQLYYTENEMKAWGKVGPKEHITMMGGVPNKSAWLRQVIDDLVSGKLKYRK